MNVHAMASESMQFFMTKNVLKVMTLDAVNNTGEHGLGGRRTRLGIVLTFKRQTYHVMFCAPGNEMR